VSGVSSEKARASLKPMLREGFTTPDNVPKKDLFFNHATRSIIAIGHLVFPLILTPDT